jgi:lysophospholipase L1-like esterase
MTDRGGDSDAAPGRRRVRRWFRAFLAAAPLVVVLGAECALRVAEFPPADDPASTAARVLDLSDPRLFTPDPELLWALRPATEFDLGDPAYPRFRTNRHGLRGADVPDERAPGELRIVCVGDSITFGQGLAEDATLPARLGAHLRSDPRLEGRVVRTVNAGVLGYGSVQGFRLLQRIAALRPDVVVWCFGMNDAKPSLGAPDAELCAGRGPAGGALAGVRLVRLGAWLRSRSRPPTRVPPADFARTLRDLESLAGELGATTIVVETPQRLGVTLEKLDAVVATARAAGAAEVRGSLPLFSAFTPSPFATDAVHHVERGTGGCVRVAFGTDDARADQVLPVAEVAARREQVRVWIERLGELNALLPADVVRPVDLFGDVPGRDVYTDNCHLTPAGADLAGAALARRVAELVTRASASGH